MRENHIGIQVSTDEFLIRVEFPNPTSFEFKQPTTKSSLIIITNISQSKRERLLLKKSTLRKNCLFF